MGAAERNPNAVPSSIALLQERFKQLHREKRRREEKEVLRLFGNPPTSFSANHSTRQYIDQTSKRRRLFYTDFSLTDKLPSKVSLSLRPSSSADCQTELWDIEAPVARKMQAEDRISLRDVSSFLNSHETDIDTSLHL